MKTNNGIEIDLFATALVGLFFVYSSLQKNDWKIPQLIQFPHNKMKPGKRTLNGVLNSNFFVGLFQIPLCVFITVV